MTFDLDPDLWLFTRLALGRRWGGLLTVAMLYGVLVAAFGLIAMQFDAHAAYVRVNFQYIFSISLSALMVIASSPAAAAAALDRDGLLDFTRLCGRPAHRILLALTVGMMGPSLLLVAVALGVTSSGLHAPPGFIATAVLVFAAASAVALIALGWLPSAASPIVVLGSFFLLSLTAVVAIRAAGWITSAAFGPSKQILAVAEVIALPFAIRTACRRLDRPPPGTLRPRMILAALSRLTPREGPAEFVREFRSNVARAAGFGVALETALLVLLFFARRHPTPTEAAAFSFFGVLLPYFATLIGALAVLATIGRQFESGTIDLVRLTPQRPAAIALGWYAGIMLPFWLVTVTLVLTFRLVGAEIFASLPATVWWSLAWAAVLLPAGFLADGRSGGGFVVAAIAAAPIILLSPLDVLDIYRLRTPMEVSAPWGLHLAVMIPPIATAVALGAACGRIRRPAGPALAGPAATAMIAAVALSARLVPVHAFPRIVVAVLPLFASLLAAPNEPATALWNRLAIATSSAAGAAAVMTWDAGFGAAVSLTTGLCAALALAISILGHELFVRQRLLAIGLPLTVMLVVLRLPPPMGRGFGSLPPFFQAADVAALGAAFVAVAWLHTRRRARAAADVSVA